MITASPRRGHVALVGAGPGDPDLLTRRAERLIRDAELIVYDALVDPRVLSLAPAARRVFVGKRAGRPAVRQEFINAFLVRNARRGLRVVRLKGGDPFVFGRGGEEGLALAAAGLSFELVPGVSNAIAAAGLANIPVTHRGVASSFVVVSGHDEAAYGRVLGSLAPGASTIVVMMAVAHLQPIASLLLSRGWPASLPLAVLFDASGPSSSVELMTLRDAASGPPLGTDGRPGTIVIGEVVRLHSQLMSASVFHAETGVEVRKPS